MTPRRDDQNTVVESSGVLLPPLLRELSEEVGATVSFHVREHGRCISLYRINSRFAQRPEAEPARIRALEGSTAGRVLLAFAGEPGSPYAEIRRSLTCLDEGECEPETSGIAAPVFGMHQSLLGALAMAGPSARFGRSVLEELRPRLLETAARATAQFGGDPAGLFAAQRAADKRHAEELLLIIMGRP